MYLRYIASSHSIEAYAELLRQQQQQQPKLATSSSDSIQTISSIDSIQTPNVRLCIFATASLCLWFLAPNLQGRQDKHDF